jgi:hypothetical protein
MLSQLQREAILRAVVDHPELSHQEIAEQFRVGRITVIGIAKKGGVKRKRGAAATAFRHSIARAIGK